MRTPQDLVCREFVELVTDYIEGALPEELAAVLESHLDVCDGCTIYLGQMRLTIRALERHRNGGLPPAMRDQLMNHFRGWRGRQNGGGEA